MSDNDILYNIWLKTPDAKKAFNKWKQTQKKNIANRMQPVQPVRVQPVRVVHDNPNSGYDTPEWHKHVRDCDRRGVDY